MAGSIAVDYSGKKGFGYDPLFIHKKTGRSYGDMTKEEKNRLSHRGVAIAMVKKELLK